MEKTKQRPLIFKWPHFEPRVILYAVRWYLRFSLSYRDMHELRTERGVGVDHSTIWRWVQQFAPELNQRLRPHRKPADRSWQVNETYVRGIGRWFYLCRAIDSQGATSEFFLSVFGDLDAAKRRFSRALRHGAHPQPSLLCSGPASSVGAVATGVFFATQPARDHYCIEDSGGTYE